MSDTPVDFNEQRRVYDDFYGDGGFLKEDPTEPKKCVLIPQDWFNKWVSYIGRCRSEQLNFSSPSINGCGPGPVDFSRIMDNGKLKSNLVLEVDVKPISEELFNHLSRWYGIEGPINGIPYRDFYKTDKNEYTFDLYPPSIKLIPRGNYVNFELNCHSHKTIGYVKLCIRKNNKLESDAEIHLWDAANKDELTDDETVTLRECSLVGDKEIEYSVGSRTLFNGDSSEYSHLIDFSPSPFPRGVCGLNNLGNTCFMNSAIQCISNVAPLRNFFLSGEFIGSINETNKLGSHGEIANAFAELIKEMWSDKKRGLSCVPRELKYKIGRYAPQFLGYTQHDAQELMNFLLDFLHEDLNRIKEKPYIEDKDADGRPDDEVATEAWSNFKRRNNSIIVDLFYGLLKSTVECPTCGYVSVTFDPFSSLSLPLDVKFLSIYVGPFALFSLPVTPLCRARDIVQSLEHHAPITDDSKYVVTRKSGNEFDVISAESNENLYGENIYVFKVTGVLYLKVLLLGKYSSESVPLLVSFEYLTNRISKQDLCNAVKLELSKYNEVYGEDFEEICRDNNLIFSFENEIFPVEPEETIVIECLGNTQVKQDPIIRLPVKLQNCVDLFLTSEQLGIHDLWYCKVCKDHQRAFKKFDLWKLPRILVVHLKRYRSSYRVSKNDVYVEYPLDDFRLPYLKDSPTYELTAVSNHMGGLGGGHYTAFAKSGNSWYSFNDTYVDKLSTPPVSSSAYILVYSSKEVSSNGH
nr:ubiquitin carboxyl terminal hydrolase 4 [Hymenolepis microstoma]